MILEDYLLNNHNFTGHGLWEGFGPAPEPGHPFSAAQLPDPVQHELPALPSAGPSLQWAEQEGAGPARSSISVSSSVATTTPRGIIFIE